MSQKEKTIRLVPSPAEQAKNAVTTILDRRDCESFTKVSNLEQFPAALIEQLKPLNESKELHHQIIATFMNACLTEGRITGLVGRGTIQRLLASNPLVRRNTISNGEFSKAKRKLIEMGIWIVLRESVERKGRISKGKIAVIELGSPELIALFQAIHPNADLEKSRQAALDAYDDVRKPIATPGFPPGIGIGIGIGIVEKEKGKTFSSFSEQQFPGPTGSVAVVEERTEQNTPRTEIQIEHSKWLPVPKMKIHSPANMECRDFDCEICDEGSPDIRKGKFPRAIPVQVIHTTAVRYPLIPQVTVYREAAAMVGIKTTDRLEVAFAVLDRFLLERLAEPLVTAWVETLFKENQIFEGPVMIVGNVLLWRDVFEAIVVERLDRRFSMKENQKLQYVRGLLHKEIMGAWDRNHDAYLSRVKDWGKTDRNIDFSERWEKSPQKMESRKSERHCAAHAIVNIELATVGGQGEHAVQTLVLMKTRGLRYEIAREEANCMIDPTHELIRSDWEETYRMAEHLIKFLRAGDRQGAIDFFRKHVRKGIRINEWYLWNAVGDASLLEEYPEDDSADGIFQREINEIVWDRRFE
jgi:hypothetical protein